MPSLVGSQMCIRDRNSTVAPTATNTCPSTSLRCRSRGAGMPTSMACTAAPIVTPRLYRVSTHSAGTRRAKHAGHSPTAVSYTHLRAHETRHDLVCRLLLEKKKKTKKKE